MADEHLISLQPGTVIAGRYEVVKCLGAGSMGLVYACRHRDLTGHLVAIKVLFPEVAQDKIATQRFHNEIKASYNVSHPNVVRAYEYLRDGDLVAYTMEYVSGGDLADRLNRRSELIPVLEIIKLLSQMCSGVQAVHDAGIVHRDLKPENILITKEGQVKIADFGIARTERGPKLTEHGGVVGTIDYVSPEYMIESHVDWRSDIYALGILGFEMITGESPFKGDSVYATMTKRLKSDPPAPSSLRPDCPVELDAIILRAMARDPKARFQSAAEMFYALQNLLPDNQKNAGSYMQLPKQASASYSGPSHGADSAEESDNEITVDRMGFEVRDDQSTANGIQAAHDTPAVMSFDDEYQTVERNMAAGVAPARRTETTTMAPNAAGGSYSFGSSYAEQEDETQRMESVLTFNNDPQTGGWEKVHNPAEISLTMTGIDTATMRRLQKGMEKVNKSMWAEILIFFFAVVIGIGVGYAVLKMVAPEMLGNELSEVALPSVNLLDGK